MTAVPPAVERREHLALGAGDAGKVAETLEVLVAGVGDERDRGLRERGERGDLARVIGAHLDHRVAVRGLEAEQRQRHADVVVEVAAGRERRARAGEDRREQFLGGRLAVAAADAEHQRAGSRARQAAASAVSAAWVSRDDHLRQRQPSAGCETTAPAAPRAAAAATNALPSKRSPRSATNSMPASIVRESVETPANAASAPARRPPAVAGVTSASRPFTPHLPRVRAGARGR